MQNRTNRVTRKYLKDKYKTRLIKKIIAEQKESENKSLSELNIEFRKLKCLKK